MFWNQSLDLKPFDNLWWKLKVKIHGWRMGCDPFRNVTIHLRESKKWHHLLLIVGGHFIFCLVLSVSFFWGYKHFALVIPPEKLRVLFSYIKGPNNLDLNCNSTQSGACLANLFLASAENILHTLLSAKCSLRTKPLVPVWCCSRRLTQKVHQ